MLPPFLAVLFPILATILGGWIVLRTRQNMRPWLSLSGGVLLGLAFLDLIPEAFEHGAEAGISGAKIGGFILGSILFFHLLDKLFDFHGHEGHGHECANEHHRPVRAWSRVSGMGFHAFLDGLAIGGGFAAGSRLGILVTLGILLHKFTDGMTTVTIMRHQGGSDEKNRSAIALAGIVALPLVGLWLGGNLVPTAGMTAVFLAVLAGLFTHLPLSELLPEAHEGKTSKLGLALTVLGIILMGVIKLLVHV
jgi:ZIP family zinc transporter